MKRWIGCGLLALASASTQAFCGFYAGKADAHLFNEASQVVIARHGVRTVLTLVSGYQGEPSEFALVVPTPQGIQPHQVQVLDPALVEQLDAYSAPRLAESHDADPCQRSRFRWGPIPRPEDPRYPPPPSPHPHYSPDPTVLGVTVETRFTRGEYDIVNLSARESEGLETWLQENGYRLPQGASAALKPYINQGMRFLVAKVHLPAQERGAAQRLRPLQLDYESPHFMLPLRLGMLNARPGQPQDLIVYALTPNGRVESQNYPNKTVPAHLNLPPLAKPSFAQVYQALFAEAAQREQHRTVFTEYVGKMSECERCVVAPLRVEQQVRLGAFWVQNPGFVAADLARFGGGGPVVLTRLHLRTTLESFPEDLMLTDTGTAQNWQARYEVQQPHEGTVAACSARLGQENCAAICRPRVAALPVPPPKPRHRMEKSGVEIPHPGAIIVSGPMEGVEASLFGNRAVLQRDCETQCHSGRLRDLSRAARYYERTVPERVAAEKRTLAQLTGWSLAEIDAMPEAHRHDAPLGAERFKTHWWARSPR